MGRRNNKLGEQSNQVAANIAEVPSLNREQMEQLLQFLKTSPPTALVGKEAQMCSAFSVTSLLSAPWIIDSGAYNHMASFPNLFQTYILCSGNKKSRIADGSVSSIAGKWSIPISEKIELLPISEV